MSRNWRAVILITLVALLVAVTLTATSCGNRSGTTTAGQSQVTSPSRTGNLTIDDVVNEIDKQMSSESADDFSDDQLKDNALGL